MRYALDTRTQHGMNGIFVEGNTQSFGFRKPVQGEIERQVSGLKRAGRLLGDDIAQADRFGLSPPQVLDAQLPKQETGHQHDYRHRGGRQGDREASGARH